MDDKELDVSSTLTVSEDSLLSAINGLDQQAAVDFQRSTESKVLLSSTCAWTFVYPRGFRVGSI